MMESLLRLSCLKLKPVLRTLPQTILFTKQKQRHREQMYDSKGGKGRDELEDWD